MVGITITQRKVESLSLLNIDQNGLYHHHTKLIIVIDLCKSFCTDVHTPHPSFVFKSCINNTPNKSEYNTDKYGVSLY
jgi:hypothetical protein